MPANVTIIGRATRVRGRITGDADIEVEGFVEGEIAVVGDVTIAAQGIVGAPVRGRRVVVRGAVKGDLIGDEAVLLEEGARVLGDVRAPRIVIAPGALVRGYVQTGEDGGAPARAARSQPMARPAPAATVQPKSVVASAHEKASPPAPAHQPPVTRAAAPAARAQAASGSNAGPRRPPPPVVPVLKGAKGQIAKKKER